MINRLLKLFANLSLSQSKGKFFADKSYAFDTLFFLSKFIAFNSDNLRFNKAKLEEKALSYVKDIFQLDYKPNKPGTIRNYYNECINLLCFSNVVTKVSTNEYVIAEPEVLNYIIDRPENAYIFSYLLAMQTFKNDGIWELFCEYCNTQDIKKKEMILKSVYDIFCVKSSSIIRKEGRTGKAQWSQQLVKYPFIVLGYINNQCLVSRSLKIRTLRKPPQILTVADLSVNVKGTLTKLYLPKKNDYLKKFNAQYVAYMLKDLLVTPKTVFPAISVEDNIVTAENLADLKLTILGKDVNGHIMSALEHAQYVANTVRTRNPNIQRLFRANLLKNNEHCCPICGFSYEKHLQASHIKPYTECDDTYDAVNHFNGFLMCPNHDKLFEAVGVPDLTIDYKTGKIILSKEALLSKDYAMLDGQYISRAYIESERRHYLEWHNNKFLEAQAN